jgi:hypothetical protein
MIKLKKMQSVDFLACKGAVWVVAGHEDVRVQQVGSRWLADVYDANGNYVRNIMKFGDRNGLVEALAHVLV